MSARWLMMSGPGWAGSSQRQRWLPSGSVMRLPMLRQSIFHLKDEIGK